MSTFNELIDFTRSTTGTYLDSVVYGPELVTNGDFSAGTTGWEAIDGNPNVSIDSNGRLKMVTNATDGWQAVYNYFGTEVGKTYAVTATVESASGNNGEAHFRGSAGNTVSIHNTNIFHRAIPSGTSQTFTLYFTATNVRTNVHLMTQINNTVYLDNVSVKEVIGGQVSGTPLLRTAAINEPRLEYDASGNPLGLLIEEARTNVLAYSEEFGNWTGQNVSISSNQTAAPDGTNTADKVEEQNTNNTFHFVTRSLSGSSAGVKTFSAYVKADERSFAGLTLRVNGGSDRLAVLFNLTSGTVSDTLTAGSPTQTSSSIQDVGNGWYRCSISAYHSAGNVIALLSPHDDGTSSTINLDYAGIVGHGIYIWGAQAEAGAFPTSYIPTSGSAVTRTVDSAVATLSDFYYRQKHGSMVVEFTSKYDESAALFNRVYEIGNTGTNVNRIMTYVKTDETRLSSSVWDNNVFQSGTTLTTSLPNGTGVYSKAAYAWETNNAHAALDGDLVGSVDTSVSLTQTRDTLGIMRGANSTNDTLTGHIKSIQYYPLRVADAKLETLTS